MKTALRQLRDDERRFVAKTNTPLKVQRWLDGLRYNWEKDGKSTLRSLRRVLKDRTAHCLEGAVAAAAVMQFHGHAPLMLCMEARDIDHNLFVYKERGRYGAIGQSRDPMLKFRKPEYRTLRDLVLSYYPYYWNYWTGDHTELTIRGYALVDLGKFKQDWVTGEEELTFIEDHLYKIPYTALWPIPGKTKFVSPRKGKLRWV